jgi:DHA1 family bicyclomycin/chloramphenicol resistance-like MFS transporter
MFAFALAAISVIGSLAVHLFMPAIPAVKATLGLSNAIAQLTFSIALFSMAFATLFYGSLSDRYGRRPVLLSGLALFLLGSGTSAAAGAMAVNPKLAGTAAGIGVFVQNFLGAAFAQLYGMIADGTAKPMMETTIVTATLGVIVGMIAFFSVRTEGR